MCKVLVADTEPLVCDVIAACLEDEGMIVECVHSGIEGADVLERSRFDLALIDVSLPGISGLELAALAANDDTPVVLMSAHPDWNHKLDEAGCPYIAKPFNLETLRDTTAEALRETHENILRVAALAERMLANTRALKAGIAESKRLLDALKNHPGLQ